jgi:hypothetical protein
MTQRNLTVDVMDLLARFRAGTRSPREKELLAVAINAILFITSTGQRYAFADFLEQLESDAPPPVVASFDTLAEAEAWLRNHPEPPDSTYVLIGDTYHVVIYLRETNHRRLIPHPVIEFHLGQLKRDGIPPAVASFNTREEAEAWLQGQAEPPRQAVLRIAGEDYLAVSHRDVNHRSLYPFSMALEVEEESEDD